jgi:hypothetical protein
MNALLNHLKPKAYRLGAISVDVTSFSVKKDGKAIDLSRTEFEIFSFMVLGSWLNPGKNFANAEFEQEFWPGDTSANLGNRLSKHISNIQAKLGSACIKRTVNGYALLGAVEDGTPPEPEFLVFQRLVAACMVATAITIAVTIIPRALLAEFRLTLSQSRDIGFALGWFHGIVGALVWATAISTSLFYLWFVVESYRPPDFPWWSALSAGGFAGFLGGLINSLALLYAQRPDTLVRAAWIASESSPRWSAFTTTGMGYSMPLFGTVIGCCCGFTPLWIIQRSDWPKLLADHPKLTDLAVSRRVLWKITSKVMRSGVPFIGIPMLAAAGIFHLLLSSPPTWSRTLGECLSIGIGGAGLDIGLLFALYILAKGVEITGDEKCSLSI